MFHDDQHGTAIVSLAALINALEITGRKKEETSVVINGAGAAGIAITKILMSCGVTDILLCDSKGIVSPDDPTLNKYKREIANLTNTKCVRGSLKDAVAGKDVFLGVSAPDVLDSDDVASMADDPIIFAMSNPVPEIHPNDARIGGARIIATGRSDFPNQINNVLAFPGLFRGALDVRARRITEEMKIAVAYAIAELVSDEEKGSGTVIPSPLDRRVAFAAAMASAKAAIACGAARLSPTESDLEETVRRRLG